MGTQTTGQAAHKAAIRREILAILRQTARDYAKFGDSSSDLRSAPEYLLNVDVARGLTRKFPRLRYRLEQPARTWEDAARIPIAASEALGKEGARFDVVLLNRWDNTPRYIIEMKRGVRILSDAKRILRLAALDHGRKRWRHGFLVTILRRTPSDAESVVRKLRQGLEALTVTTGLPAGTTVGIRCEWDQIGEARANSKKPTEAIYGVVFQLSLLQGNENLDGPDQDDTASNGAT